MKKNRAVPIAATAITVIACLSAAELLVRSANRIRPASTAVAIEVDPPGRHMNQRHPTLGYSLVPNQKLTVTLSDEIKFTSTISSAGTRVTHPFNSSQSRKPRPQIWILGCSFSFGWGVNDEETYPWRLQQRLPEYEITNFGVNGYGTLQSLIQVEEELRNNSRRKPAIVVLAYHWQHELHNTMSPARIKELGLRWQAWGEVDQPFASLTADGELVIHKSKPYRPYFPFIQYSALANALDWEIAKYLERDAALKDRRTEVTLEIIRRITRLVRANGAVFMIADLGDPASDRVRSLARTSGIPWTHVVIPDRPEMFLPGDGHPSARGHQLIAEQLSRFISNQSEHDIDGRQQVGVSRQKKDRR